MSGKPLVSFDYAIKYLLKDKTGYEIIESFISALLQYRGYEKVKIVAQLDGESNSEKKMGKRSLADLIVEDEHRQQYIIEIERSETTNFVHKACFNASRMIVDRLKSGVDYSRIKKVFHISLLYFPVGKKPFHYAKTDFYEFDTGEPVSLHLKDQETQRVFDATEVLPEYFVLSVPLFDGELRDELHEWLYVMQNSQVPPNPRVSCMPLVEERLSVLKMNQAEQHEYWYYQKQLRQEQDALTFARGEGELKGRREGELKGRREGELKGRREGKAEGKVDERRSLLTQLVAKGMALEEVARWTSISLEEVKELLAFSQLEEEVFEETGECAEGLDN